ncbi:tetraspanin-33-like [Ornithodoros turicata]|uniref:tetraspanin-33-like n=1 Tax=Ornithodoros turicata TaxID=34597 RepID=UPI00313A33C2
MDFILSGLNSINRFIPDYFIRPFLIAFNCFGMLITGTLSSAVLLEFLEHHYIHTKGGRNLRNTALAQVIATVELGLISVGVSLFAVFALGFTAVVRNGERLLSFYLKCLVVLSAMAFSASLCTACLPFVASPLVSRLIGADGLKMYGIAPEWDRAFNLVQVNLQCCGIGSGGFREWSHNDAFKCSADNPSSTRCGVPSSCCKTHKGVRADSSCGRGVQNQTDAVAWKRVYRQGCVQAAMDSLRGRMIPLGGSVIVVALLVIIAAASTRYMSMREEARRRKRDQEALSKSSTLLSVENPYAVNVDYGSSSHGSYDLQTYMPDVPVTNRYSAAQPYVEWPPFYEKGTPFPGRSLENARPWSSPPQRHVEGYEPYVPYPTQEGYLERTASSPVYYSPTKRLLEDR